ncbi:hypothetical protein B0O80DRAFT_448718 [Mortierella sp. GBAus27b]|nr:hypothetical protein B0O80DRAFT_448718 [Mortierella sp. GBAus27b]
MPSRMSRRVYSRSELARSLDISAHHFVSLNTRCHVDNPGNFVWFSPKSAANSSFSTGPHYTVSAGSNARGSWSLIHPSTLPSTHATDYIWPSNGVRNLGVLTNSNLVQSNRTWSLDPATFGIPRSIAYNDKTLYLLGSNKVLSLLPVDTLADNVALFQTKLESDADASVKHIPLTNLSDDCLDSHLASLHSTAVGNTFYLLCSSPSTSAASRLFTYNGALFKGPYETPMLKGHTDISSFAAISSSKAGDPDILFVSTSNSTFGLATGTRVNSRVVLAGGDGVSMFTNITLPTSPTPIAPTPTDTSSSDSSDSSSQGNDDMVKGIVSGFAAFICILLILYCRYRRKGGVEGRIQRIFRRNDGSVHVDSSDPAWPTQPYPLQAQARVQVQPPLQPQPQQQFVQYSQHNPTQGQDIHEEDLRRVAMYEYELQQLGPAPSPSIITHPSSPPASPPSSSLYQQHLPSAYIQSVNQHGKDIVSTSLSPDLSSAHIGHLHVSDPKHTAYYVPDLSQASSSSYAYHGKQHSRLSDGQVKNGKTLEADDDEPPTVPPPTPYLERATQFLNSASAPAPGPSPDHGGHV